MARKKVTRPGRLRLAAWGLTLGVFSMAGVGLCTVLLTLIGLIPLWLGIPGTVLVAGWLRGYSDLHRLWAGRVFGVPIVRPYRSTPPGTGWFGRLKARLTDPALWRDLAWTLVNSTAGLVLCLLPASLLAAGVFYLAYPLLYEVTPAGVLANPLGLFTLTGFGETFLLWVPAAAAFGVFAGTVRPIMRGYAALTRSLLGPVRSTSLAGRVAQLTESRADAVDTQAAELRRIERDLHDGAQARLVALGMSLGMAEELLLTDPHAAQQLLSEARESSGLALSELRDLVRGIHPPVLADRGLDGAVRAQAMASPLPVEVTSTLTGRLTPAVESAAYFAVVEVLTNVAKHSGATSAWIRIDHADDQLSVMIGDDGRGGADVREDGGLAGIERRLAAFDGTMMVTSPIGGPTIVTITLPAQVTAPTPS
jgi:signal transduction histidine kinase